MSISVGIKSEDTAARLAGAGDRLDAALKRTVTRLAIEIQSAVKVKLSGSVLHNVTGTLRRSINQRVTQDGGNTRASVGTNIRYAAIHEFGFEGDVRVRAFQRKTGKGKIQNVREHARHMKIPERSFLRSTLLDFSDRIHEDIKKAALGALK